MQENYQISVVVPVFNAQHTLKRLIDSFLIQVGVSSTDYEIIFVDDGSVDDSFIILNEFEKKYDNIRVVHQDNCGPSAARNKGIKMSKGQYILFCDSDDYVEPDILSSLISSYQIQPSDLVIFGLYDEFIRGKEKIAVYQHRGIEKFYKTRYEFLLDFHSILDNNLLYSQCTKLYSKKLLDDNLILFDETLSMGEDIRFNLNCFSKVNRVAVLNGSYYHYVHNLDANSVSSSYCEDYFQNICEVACLKKKLLLEENALTTDNLISLNNYFMGRISSSIQNAFLKPNVSLAYKINTIKDIISNNQVRFAAAQYEGNNRLYNILAKGVIKRRRFWIALIYWNLLFIKKHFPRLVQKLK